MTASPKPVLSIVTRGSTGRTAVADGGDPGHVKGGIKRGSAGHGAAALGRDVEAARRGIGTIPYECADRCDYADRPLQRLRRRTAARRGSVLVPMPRRRSNTSWIL